MISRQLLKKSKCHLLKTLVLWCIFVKTRFFGELETLNWGPFVHPSSVCCTFDSRWWFKKTFLSNEIVHNPWYGFIFYMLLFFIWITDRLVKTYEDFSKLKHFTVWSIYVSFHDKMKTSLEYPNRFLNYAVSNFSLEKKKKPFSGLKCVSRLQ